MPEKFITEKNGRLHEIIGIELFLLYSKKYKKIFDIDTINKKLKNLKKIFLKEKNKEKNKEIKIKIEILTIRKFITKTLLKKDKKTKKIEKRYIYITK